MIGMLLVLITMQSATRPHLSQGLSTLDALVQEHMMTELEVALSLS
jgi:hypothetical protein